MRVDIGGGVRLFFDVEGAGFVPDGTTMRARPTVVLVHGGPGADHSMFKPVLGALADVAQIVYLDLRGQGRSDRRAPHEWNLTTWAADIVAFCAALDIEDPVVVGDSAGTYVVLAYAARHPEHPSAIALASAAGRNQPERQLAVFERLGGPAARAAAEAFWADPTGANRTAYTRHCLMRYRQRSAPVDEAAFRILQTPEVGAHFMIGERRTFDLLPELGAITCPVLVMNGAHDPVTTMEDAEDVVAAIRSDLVRFERFEDCGHSLFAEDPERALRHVRELIASVAG